MITDEFIQILKGIEKTNSMLVEILKYMTDQNKLLKQQVDTLSRRTHESGTDITADMPTHESAYHSSTRRRGRPKKEE